MLPFASSMFGGGGGVFGDVAGALSGSPATSGSDASGTQASSGSFGARTSNFGGFSGEGLNINPEKIALYLGIGVAGLTIFRMLKGK
jgi:hypothetical protein